MNEWMNDNNNDDPTKENVKLLLMKYDYLVCSMSGPLYAYTGPRQGVLRLNNKWLLGDSFESVSGWSNNYWHLLLIANPSFLCQCMKRNEDIIINFLKVPSFEAISFFFFSLASVLSSE